MSKSLVRAAQHKIVHSEDVSGAVGRMMVAAGGGGLLLLGAAALIPFVSFFWLCVVLLGVGVFMAG